MSDLDGYSRADWSLLPEAIRDTVRNYVDHGLNPGTFVTSVITGDLFSAVNTASADMSASLADIARFFVRYVPGEAWGSQRNFVEWKCRGGLSGYREEDGAPINF